MLTNKDLIILAHLRSDARMTLTTLSRKTRVPISTLFDKLRQYQDHEVKRHCALLNFQKLGFGTRALVLLKVGKQDKEKLQEYLRRHSNVNSLSQINNGFDFLCECVFREMKELEFFLDSTEEHYAIKGREVHYVIEDVKREAFLEDPCLVSLVTEERVSTVTATPAPPRTKKSYSHRNLTQNEKRNLSLIS